MNTLTLSELQITKKEEINSSIEPGNVKQQTNRTPSILEENVLRGIFSTSVELPVIEVAEMTNKKVITAKITWASFFRLM